MRLGCIYHPQKKKPPGKGTACIGLPYAGITRIRYNGQTHSFTRQSKGQFQPGLSELPQTVNKKILSFKAAPVKVFITLPGKDPEARTVLVCIRLMAAFSG
jgi:hypothetical protein